MTSVSNGFASPVVTAFGARALAAQNAVSSCQLPLVSNSFAPSRLSVPTAVPYGSFGKRLLTQRAQQFAAQNAVNNSFASPAVSNGPAFASPDVSNSFASSCWGDPRVNATSLAGFQFTPTSSAGSERLPAVVVSRKTLALERLRQFTPTGVNEYLELATSLPTSTTQLTPSLPTRPSAVPVFDFGALCANEPPQLAFVPTSLRSDACCDKLAQLTLEPTDDDEYSELAQPTSTAQFTPTSDDESVTDPIKLMKSLVGKGEQSVLIVHNAIDGLSCAVLAIAGGFRGDVFSYPAESISEDLLKPYKQIYMADIGISESLFTKLNSSGKDVHIYDHHARNSFAGRYDGSVMDPRRSSTRIFYDEYGKGRFLFPETVNEFVDGIDVVARWQLNDSRFQKAVRFLHLFTGLSDSSKASCGVLYSNKEFNDLRDTEYVKTCVERLRHPLPHFFSEEDFAIINSENRKMDVCFEETMETISYRTDEVGRRFAVCRVHGNTSLILDRILKKASFISYVIGIGDVYRGMVRVSARAKDVSVDLNQLEGFEGHPTAAGALYTPNKAKALLYNKKLFVGVKRDQKPYRWEDRPSLKERAKRGAPPRRLRQRAMHSQGMD